MADIARPVPRARVAHKQQSSQDEFTKRLKHLQRSDPVNPDELTRRLNVAITEARHGVSHRRRRNANTRGLHGDRSRSRTPSEEPTPKQNARQSTLNPLDVARSSMVCNEQHDEDPLSRVANALRVCRDADPHRLGSGSSQQKEGEEKDKIRWESAAQAQDEFAEISKAVARRSVVFTAPKVVEIEKPKEPMPRPPPSVLPAPSLATAMKKRASRKAPPPLILTVMPKAVKPAIVNVSSPITTKAPSGLPNLEPLSPFGANFSENAGSFLVYEPKEIRHSLVSVDSTRAQSTGPESLASPAKSLSAVAVAKVARLAPASNGESLQHITAYMGNPQSVDGATETLQQSGVTTHTQNNGNTMPQSRKRRRRKSVPSIVLSENSETEGTDTQSDRAISPVFEASAAVSSRTSLGQHPVAAQMELKKQPSKRIGFPPDQVFNSGNEAVPSQATAANHEPMLKIAPFPPVSPLPVVAYDDYSMDYDNCNVSPLASPSLITLPKRISSLPEAQQPSSNTNRFSIPRKPVGSGCYDGFVVSTQAIKQTVAHRSIRHDSTGFTVAREYLRNSVDGDPVRHVQTAAHRGSDTSLNGHDAISSPQQLPKLTTTTEGQKPGRWETIGDGICLIESDSPTVGNLSQKLPIPTNPQFRTPSYTREIQASPSVSRQNSASVQSPGSTSLALSYSSSQLHRESSAALDLDESPAVVLKRALSRGRSGTDAAITSLSSKPDYRARPVIQDAPEIPVASETISRPRTAGARSLQPTPMPALPTKMPAKIKFPPRANNSEVAAMSPESLKLLHEQEALLRKRYDAVLNPIDDALRKRPAEQVLSPALIAVKKQGHTHSKSVDIHFAVKEIPVQRADIEFVRQQDQIARERVAIRAQRRNLGAAVKRPSAPDQEESFGQSPLESPRELNGEPMGLPDGFPSPTINVRSAFTFDDDTQRRRSKAKWKFWKAK